MKRERKNFPSCWVFVQKRKRFFPVIVSFSSSERNLNPLRLGNRACAAVKNNTEPTFLFPFKITEFQLTSDMFISSISARVGALSRMRGRVGGRGPSSDTDRSMHEVDLTLQGHVWARQGREPNAEGRETRNQKISGVLRSEESNQTHPVYHFGVSAMKQLRLIP